MRFSHFLAQFRRIIPRVAATVFGVVLTACSDSALPPPTAPSVHPSFAQQAQGPSRTDTPWRLMTDAELGSKIAEAGARVFIGFKDPGAAGGVDELGRVLASASSVAAAKAQLRALGVDFEIEFIDMPMVAARMSAGLLPQVRQNPLIEYVEPIFPGVRLVQTTTWNVDRVNAPTAWSYSTGSGAKLLIIDSGIENTHPDLAPAVVQSCESPPGNGLDLAGHGTNVSGVAAAVNNDIQIVGVAYGVSLWTSKDGNAQPNPAYTACGSSSGGPIASTPSTSAPASLPILPSRIRSTPRTTRTELLSSLPRGIRTAERSPTRQPWTLQSLSRRPTSTTTSLHSPRWDRRLSLPRPAQVSPPRASAALRAA